MLDVERDFEMTTKVEKGRKARPPCIDLNTVWTGHVYRAGLSDRLTVQSWTVPFPSRLTICSQEEAVRVQS